MRLCPKRRICAHMSCVISISQSFARQCTKIAEFHHPVILPTKNTGPDCPADLSDSVPAQRFDCIGCRAGVGASFVWRPNERQADYMTSPNPLLAQLGYSPDARLVIFHADDVGMCHGSNRAFLDLQPAGIVRTGSIMAPCPWAPEILTACREQPDLDIGVHLTLNSEWSCLLYTSDAADERSSVDLGGRRILKKKKAK